MLSCAPRSSRLTQHNASFPHTHRCIFLLHLYSPCLACFFFLSFFFSLSLCLSLLLSLSSSFSLPLFLYISFASVPCALAGVPHTKSSEISHSLPVSAGTKRVTFIFLTVIFPPGNVQVYSHHPARALCCLMFALDRVYFHRHSVTQPLKVAFPVRREWANSTCTRRPPKQGHQHTRTHKKRHKSEPLVFVNEHKRSSDAPFVARTISFHPFSGFVLLFFSLPLPLPPPLPPPSHPHPSPPAPCTLALQLPEW